MIPRQTCTCLRGLSSAWFGPCLSSWATLKESLIDFFDIHGERKKNKKLKKINLKRNDNHLGSIFSFRFSWTRNVLWDRLKAKFIQECFEFITFHYSNCCVLRVLNSRETDRKKSTKSSHVDTQKTFKKNLTNFSSTHMRICVKDASPVRRDFYYLYSI